ncbi:MAG: TonB-dependent receptor plug domain-containing protein [Rhodothermales bacterium]|nr:TonB-dependent receptor plug domain-containing protein [Rhodothermales bacterium]
MKTVSLSLALLLLATLAAGCSGSRGSSEPPADDPDLTAADIEQRPTRSLQDLLVERVPGVTILEGPGGSLKVRIRGQSSFRGDDAPLFVVDGLPVEPERDGSLPGLPISEIESIRVLKDPADTALYGVRGANGVIVVKTKRGK